MKNNGTAKPFRDCLGGEHFQDGACFIPSYNPTIQYDAVLWLISLLNQRMANALVGFKALHLDHVRIHFRGLNLFRCGHHDVIYFENPVKMKSEVNSIHQRVREKETETEADSQYNYTIERHFIRNYSII